MSRRLAQTIDPSVAATLRSSHTEGHKLFLPKDLERKHYERCNDALQRIGGKWSRRDQAHVFDEEAKPLLEGILGSGQVPARNKHDYFPTPPAVIERMIEIAEMDRYHSAYEFPLMVLEPSAGEGAIVRAVADAQPEAIIRAFEIDPKRAQRLAASGLCDVTCGDFLAAEISVRYDRVAMNPPFTSPTDSLVYIEHIRRAYGCLEPGGILVSVAPAGVRFRTDKRVREFREWVLERGEIEDLPDSAFAASGTGVSTVLITLRGEATVMTDHDITDIAPDVREILRGCTIEGRVVKMPVGVPIQIHSRVQDTLVRLGGHWSDTLGGFWYAGEAPHFDYLISITKEESPVTTLLDTDEQASPPPGEAPDHGLDNNPGEGDPPDAGRVDLILLSDIIPNTMQPRSEFDPVALDELAESIRAHGVLQPITVRPWGEGTYELIAGERRWRASKLAGKDRIPAIVRVGVSDEKSALWALKENLDRSDLNAIDTARGFNNLITRFGWTQARVAAEFSIDQPTVAARLALLDFPLEAQEHFAKGNVSPTHGKVLMGIKDPAVIVRLVQSAVDEHWSVARTREEVAAYNREQEALAGQTSLLDVPGVKTPGTSSSEVCTPDDAASYPDNGGAAPHDTTETEDTAPHDIDESDQAEAEEEADTESVSGDPEREQESAEDGAPSEYGAESALSPHVTEVVAAAPIPPTSAVVDGGANSSASSAAASSTPQAPASPQASTPAPSSPSSAATQAPKLAAEPPASPAEAERLKRQVAELQATIAAKDEQIKRMQTAPPGFKRALIKEDTLDKAMELGLWPIQRAIDMLTELNASVQSALHPLAVEGGKLLEEWNRTAQVMTPDETEILHELYPERETTTYSMMASVLLIKRGRRFVQSSDAQEAGISE